MTRKDCIEIFLGAVGLIIAIAVFKLSVVERQTSLAANSVDFVIAFSDADVSESYSLMAEMGRRPKEVIETTTDAAFQTLEIKLLPLRSLLEAFITCSLENVCSSKIGFSLYCQRTSIYLTVLQPYEDAVGRPRTSEGLSTAAFIESCKHAGAL